jgi:hypothetical protein
MRGLGVGLGLSLDAQRLCSDRRLGIGSDAYEPAKGERWFCSEAEAKAAGWRAPYR